MSGSWLDITENGVPGRRAVLREGLTRLGGGDAEIPLGGAGSDQLHLWNRPPRALFVGRGPRPLRNGVPFDESGLRPGDRVEWAGAVLTYGGEAAAEDQAALEELPLPSGAPGGFSSRTRTAQRLLAGLCSVLGLADEQAAKRWRQAVLEDRFDPDQCARELFPSELPAGGEQRLLERSGTLLRDFLMAPFLSGTRGASRRLRGAARHALAFLVVQALSLLALAAILLVLLLVLRVRGFSLDELLDRILPG